MSRHRGSRPMSRYLSSFAPRMASPTRKRTISGTRISRPVATRSHRSYSAGRQRQQLSRFSPRKVQSSAFPVYLQYISCTFWGLHLFYTHTKTGVKDVTGDQIQFEAAISQPKPQSACMLLVPHPRHTGTHGLRRSSEGFVLPGRRTPGYRCATRPDYGARLISISRVSGASS